MTVERDIAWVNELRKSDHEGACVEFKRNYIAFRDLGGRSIIRSVTFVLIGF